MKRLSAASLRGYLPSSPLTRMLLVDLLTPRILLQKLRCISSISHESHLLRPQNSDRLITDEKINLGQF